MGRKVSFGLVEKIMRCLTSMSFSCNMLYDCRPDEWITSHDSLDSGRTFLTSQLIVNFTAEPFKTIF